MILKSKQKHVKMQVDGKAKAQTLTTTLSSSQAFHRTPCGRAQETNTKAW
jgi:hypothetical protein